jgi:hypothetical protein
MISCTSKPPNYGHPLCTVAPCAPVRLLRLIACICPATGRDGTEDVPGPLLGCTTTAAHRNGAPPPACVKYSKLPASIQPTASSDSVTSGGLVDRKPWPGSRTARAEPSQDPVDPQHRVLGSTPARRPRTESSLPRRRGDHGFDPLVGCRARAPSDRAVSKLFDDDSRMTAPGAVRAPTSRRRKRRATLAALGGHRSPPSPTSRRTIRSRFSDWLDTVYEYIVLRRNVPRQKERSTPKQFHDLPSNGKSRAGS